MPTINLPIPELHVPDSDDTPLSVSASGGVTRSASSSGFLAGPSSVGGSGILYSGTGTGTGSGTPVRTGSLSGIRRARASSVASGIVASGSGTRPPSIAMSPSPARGRSRANSAASISLAAALASGAVPPRPISPALLSPPLRPTSPLAHPTIVIPASKEEKPPSIKGPDSAPPAEESTPIRVAAHYAGLVLAAMLGTLIRLGLDAIGTYDGRIIFPLAWAQGVGCGIMGLAAARKNQLYWWYPPLHTFIGTGIAGSVTTFSSWMLEGFLSFSNFESFDRQGFHDTVDGVAYSLSTLAISIASLYLGHHVSSLLPSLPARRVSAVPKRTPLLDTLMLLSAVLSYLAALLLYFLAPAFWRHRATFAILLAPPGAMLRYFLSRLNTLPPVAGKFPLGTFAANMVATLVVAGTYAAQRRPSAIGIAVQCDALNALQQGFCGCLSTVSTFVVELTTLRKKWAWIYLWTSVALGHIFVLAVLGGVKWDLGLLPVCRGTD